MQGDGCLERLGEFAAREQGTRALIVTDQGILDAGHVDKARASLEAAGLVADIFSEVHENPTTEDVAACVTKAREFGADILIGLGGGSSMDAAKGCNFILTNGGEMEDYWGLDKATEPMLPFIAIPTTAGTGSECQRFALISKVDTHAKMACGDHKAAARVALLDPTLTVTQPTFVTACTGMDAITHAVETAVTNKANEASLACSHEAFRLLIGHFKTAIESPEDLEARTAMQVGAALAGAAIEASMLGAAHSMANPLTAHFDIVHGQAVGLALPAIVRFNGADPRTAEMYKTFMQHAGLAEDSTTPLESVEKLADIL
ncbi:MAG: iron-containing alcohol dehydrogenase, partial [Verrucomicrobiota bacterium]